MSTELKPFVFQSHQLRVEADEHGNPWFCAKDACDILGYANDSDAIKKHCKPDGVANRYPIQDSLGRIQYPTFINEGNLYRLIIKSNKPQAEPFERKVCDEILPTIRKTGGYLHIPQGPLTLAEFNRLWSAWEDAGAALQSAPVVVTGRDALDLAGKAQAGQARAATRAANPYLWTEKEDADLLRLRGEGLGYRSIGKELGRTHKAVEHRLQRLAGSAAQQVGAAQGAAP